MLYNVSFTENKGSKDQVKSDYIKLFPYFSDLKDNEVTDKTKKTIIQLLANKRLDDSTYEIKKFNLVKDSTGQIFVNFIYCIDKKVMGNAEIKLIPIEVN